MQSVKKQLPQLDPLVSFEAAARHSSFALAARELNITASAISQQIRNLEKQLGVELFRRGHRSVQLTDRGREFHNSVSVALLHLVNAANQARTGGEAERLEISTDTSVAALWLAPRIERFEALHPDVALRINVTDVQADLLGGDFDVAIVHGDGAWRGFEGEALFAEEVFPVCSPGYLDALGPDRDAAGLAMARLLDLEYEHWHWMNWAIWLTELDLPLPDRPRRLRANNYPLIIDAARRGAGVALGWRYLVDDDLTSGMLVRPVSDVVRTANAYHVVWPYNQPMSAAAESFKDWLLGERNAQARGIGR